MTPQHFIEKNCKTLKERLNLAYKTLNTYLSAVEVESVLKMEKNGK